MKVIFIRGLPGTGKTAVAEKLKNKIPNSELINVDYFKIKAMQNGENFESAKEIAYEQSLRKLYEFHLMGKDYVIVDELICEREFLKRLYVFLIQTNSHSFWFRLLRPIKKLLELESTRKRKIKNTLEDFNNLKRETENLKIKNEHWIKNDDLNSTCRQIFSFLK